MRRARRSDAPGNSPRYGTSRHRSRSTPAGRACSLASSLRRCPVHRPRSLVLRTRRTRTPSRRDTTPRRCGAHDWSARAACSPRQALSAPRQTDSRVRGTCSSPLRPHTSRASIALTTWPSVRRLRPLSSSSGALRHASCAHGDFMPFGGTKGQWCEVAPDDEQVLRVAGDPQADNACTVGGTREQ